MSRNGMRNAAGSCSGRLVGGNSNDRADGRGKLYIGKRIVCYTRILWASTTITQKISNINTLFLNTLWIFFNHNFGPIGIVDFHRGAHCICANSLLKGRCRCRYPGVSAAQGVAVPLRRPAAAGEAPPRVRGAAARTR